ncbi:MAG TPA: hypothetical protein VH186_14695 [Chloroflexia bacterium]|nr:hypothetical protein [Chloroflexia bacterium]
MALSLFGKSKYESLAFFTGFKNVRPVLSVTGNEKFGVIELAPEYALTVFHPSAYANRRQARTTPVFTAALRLNGTSLNRWLADGHSDQAFYTALCKALPADSSAQFLLRRRNGQLGAHYQAWQQFAMLRMRDEEVAHFFLQDYLDNVIYPAEDSGLTQLWYGLFISGRTEEELTITMARLISTLPCEATACSSSELSVLLLDYFAPAMLEDQVEPFNELIADDLTGNPLEISEEHFDNGYSSAYWTLSAPPLKSESGWTTALLESPLLAASEFDISVHLTPAQQDNSVREVLERRITYLADQLDKARREGRRGDAQELDEQLTDVQNRFAGLFDEELRYFELGVGLVLRALPEEFSDAVETFEDELEKAGIASHRVQILSVLQNAMLDCAPLNLNRLERPFIIPASEAGSIVHLAVNDLPEQPASQPLVGISVTGEPVFTNPAAKAGRSAFFLLGEQGKTSAKEAASLAHYMAAMRWIKGGAVCGFDRKGSWTRLVEQLGGRYVAFGPAENEFNFNPLEVTGESLNQPGGLESWISDTGSFLSALLELDEELHEDLTAVLVESALAKVNRGEEITAASMWIRSETSGYFALSHKLRQLTYSGRYGWLCARPTRLPLPVYTHDMLFLGLSNAVRSTWSEQAQQFYFARLFARFTAHISINLPARPYLLLVDEAQELLSDPPATRSLGWLGQNAGKIGVSLWLLAPRPDEWLNSYTGRGLLERATTQLFFNQSGVGLTGLARRMGLSQRFVKAVRETVPGAAIVREIDEDGEANVYAFNPLPGEYVARLGYAPVQITAPLDQSEFQRPKPVEVPLFASEEIWDETDLQELKQAEETGWTELEDTHHDDFSRPAVAYA